MNVEICFLTNACQAGLPNLTKFNQTAHLADESRREGGWEEERKRRRGGEEVQPPFSSSRTETMERSRF